MLFTFQIVWKDVVFILIFRRRKCWGSWSLLSLAFISKDWIKLNWIEFASNAADTILYAAQKWLLTILAILITFNKFCIADDAAAIAMSSMLRMLPLLLLHFCSNEQASKCNSCYCWRCCCCWALLQCESFNDRKLNISALILSLRR